MKKRKALNVISVITQLAQIIYFCAVPFLRIQVDSYYNTPNPIFDPHRIYSMLQMVLIAPEGKFLALIALMIFNLVLCIIAISSKKTKKDGIIHTVTPIIMLVINVLCFGEGFIAIYDYNTTMMAPFDIIYWVFNVALIILAIAKRSANVVGEEEPKVEKAVVEQTVVEQKVVETTSADEIKKYKELLDMGAITQEEFDEKKKALLNQ